MTTETTAQSTSTHNTAQDGSQRATVAERVVPPVRLAVDELVPHINKAMYALDAAARKTQLEAPLLELVRTRASQLNGCAYCVDMHTKDAREGGETERRLYALAVWRETPFFTDRERAALELTEAATRLADAPVSDDLIAEVAKHFTEVE